MQNMKSVKSQQPMWRASRQAVPGGAHTVAVGALRQPAAVLDPGRAEELAVFAALTPLKQLRQA